MAVAETQVHPRANEATAANLIERAVDILPAINGEDSDGAGCWSGLVGGFLPQRPYPRRGRRRGLTFCESRHSTFGQETYSGIES